MSRKYYILALSLLLALAIKLFPAAPQPAPTTQKSDDTLYKVTKVIDGDTIKIWRNDHEETLRLLGIDTPETDPTYNPVECYGKEATNETRTKLLGQNIKIESDASQATYDKYHRLLVYVFKDGEKFNEHLIQGGFAREYTYDGAYKYQDSFKATEREARNANRGLWSPENCPQQH